MTTRAAHDFVYVVDAVPHHRYPVTALSDIWCRQVIELSSREPKLKGTTVCFHAACAQAAEPWQVEEIKRLVLSAGAWSHYLKLAGVKYTAKASATTGLYTNNLVPRSVIHLLDFPVYLNAVQRSRA